MTTGQQAALRELLRRVDEVRGLSTPTGTRASPRRPGVPVLLGVLGSLVDELERSHRRLIESHVQLISLREVASRMVNAQDGGETTRTVTRYLRRAFGFESAFLALVDPETQRLVGTWTTGQGGEEQSFRLELPLLGDRGALARSLWFNQSLLLRDPIRHPPASLPEDHPLAETLGRLGSFACVPLQRSQTAVPAGQTHELCGARCALGDSFILTPPPGLDDARWAHEREERQRLCLGCELFPLLGTIGAARAEGSPPLGAADLSLLESIALSIAPVVENARLYAELRRSERFREHVLNGMPSAVVAANLSGVILSLNRAAEELTGYRTRDVAGRPASEVLGAELGACLDSTLSHGRELQRQGAPLKGPGGATLEVSVSTSLLRDDRRQVYGVIATLVDLAPLRRAEEQARRLDRLAALGRFTSSVAHEIRNPLTGIAAGVEYLARSIEESGPQRENLTFILSEIRRLDRIVQKLFDITHPQALQPVSASLLGSLERALQSLKEVLERHRVGVRVDAGANLPDVIHDPDQMQQVWINLLKNAAEACAPGSEIRVRVTRAPGGSTGPLHPGHAPWLRAIVEDPGAGIAPEHLQSLFEPFFTTKEGGTGLGLYVSYDIVKRHGGHLRVRSEPGRGTRFTIELPLESNGGVP